ncbi:MAG: phospho-N-acetylmuramoyl-pentapeptide-transferase [Erysipelotrichaceae bacterium]
MVFKLFTAVMSCLALMVFLMPYFIKCLQKIKYNQIVSEYSIQEYKDKKSTPTMGGVLFVLVPIIVCLGLVENPLSDLKLMVTLFAYLAYGLIGFIDDYIIVIKKDNAGLIPSHKLILQISVSVIFYLIYASAVSTTLYIPIFQAELNLGIFYAFFVFFMFTAESNAVNITDGMDGLAGGLSLIGLVPFAILAWLANETSILIFIVCVIGALMGYLKFNISPAKIFMGDTGALALGGLFAAIAMVLKEEIALIFIGGVFVYEISCVVIQLTSVKLRKKRVFRYTPIHYSFVLAGLKEKTVVKNFWILGVGCAIIGLIMGVL